MNGLLLVDKPTAWSSYDVIRQIKTVLKTANPNKNLPKLGHSGTLDPMATGLLIVLVGAATKLQSQFLHLDKVYEAEITLGASSSTDDAEGKISSQKSEVRSQKSAKPTSD